MITAFLFAAYVAFGMSFTATFTEDMNTLARMSKASALFTRTIVFLTWPIWLLFKLGAAAGR